MGIGAVREWNFNPRSREGSDTHTTKPYLFRQAISIHAPAKGATKGNLPYVLLRLQFQSTLPRRERPATHHSPRIYRLKFQSTLPRRERLLHIWFKSSRLDNFNPRSREGSDTYKNISWDSSNISIHAPAKGATQGITLAGVFFDISIHAPAKGATARQRQAHRGRKDFNPRSREGSD